MSRIVGLRQKDGGRWTWNRKKAGRGIQIALGTNEAVAKELAAEYNRLVAGGLSPEEVRVRVEKSKYDSLAGLYQKEGAFGWRRFHARKRISVSLGTNEAVAKELAAECNRMFEDGRSYEETRARIAERRRDPLRGLCRKKNGGFTWRDVHAGKQRTLGLGGDEVIAKELVAECNRLATGGRSYEDILDEITRQRAYKEARLPEAGASVSNIKPHWDWLG